MQIVAFEDLERHARDEYQRRFANLPEPRVLNAAAAVTLDAPRSFVWGGVGYWAPPLSFEDGLRLLALSSFLRDAIRQGKAPAARTAARQVALFVRSVIRTHHPPWWRPISRWRHAVAHAITFLDDPPEQVEAVAQWLLHVPDESPVVPSDRRATVDLLDNRYAFEDRFKRRPDSWADYVYGMHYIGRAVSREDLRRAASVRIGVNADKDGWRDYERELRSVCGAGWL